MDNGSLLATKRLKASQSQGLKDFDVPWGMDLLHLQWSRMVPSCKFMRIHGRRYTILRGSNETPNFKKKNIYIYNIYIFSLIL